MSPTVTIVPTGSANIASVAAALRRLGTASVLASAADEIRDASAVVLPGVGAFGPATQRIDDAGWRAALIRRVGDDRPTLAICLGMQLLFEASEESPGARGLGVVPGTVTRLGRGVRVPQLGWNGVSPNGRSRYVDAGWAYFANSYRVEAAPAGWAVATTEYGGRFVSSIERGNVLACQFHPELSGPWGSTVLRRWLTAAEEAS